MQGPEFILILTVFAAGAWLLRPVVLAFSERLRGGRAGDGEIRALRAEVQALLDEHHRLRTDLGELAERVDFTERVLAAQRDAPRLPGT